MTNTKNTKKIIVETIIESLENLYIYDFSKPQVIEKSWSTSVVLMQNEFALEIEIDWREFDIFVLVVRLENGKMPDGYYVSQGRRCRHHLQKIIIEQNWKVDRDAFSMLLPNKKNKHQKPRRTEEYLIEMFRIYKKVLDSCIENLVEKGSSLF